MHMTRFFRIAWLVAGLVMIGFLHVARAATTGIVASSMHSYVLDNGNVLGWGMDGDGRLGTGINGGLTPSQGRVTPTLVSGLNVHDIVAVASGFAANHALALRRDGTVVAWGFNAFGALGNGTSSTTWVRTPQPVPGLTSIIAVANGNSCSFALDSTGILWAWGMNAYGGLGLGDFNDRYSPTAIAGTRFVAVSTSCDHTLAIDDAGRVWSWGYNAYGELGLGFTSTYVTSPRMIGTLSGITQVQAGYFHSLALSDQGIVYSWGQDSYGQLGDGSPAANQSAPVQVVGLNGPATSISAGDAHSLALVNGRVFAWGANNYFQLGLGNQIGQLAATAVNVPVTVVGISAGQRHSLVVGSRGEVYGWGYNPDGRVGNGVADPTNSAVMLPVRGVYTYACLSLRANNPPPGLEAWLASHSNISGAIKWQASPQKADAYAMPTDAQKIAYPGWSPQAKDDLAAAYRSAFDWLTCGTEPIMGEEGLTDRPRNVERGASATATTTVFTSVSIDYAWKLYTAYVGFTLAAEIKHALPWSIVSYTGDALFTLLDSGSMGNYVATISPSIFSLATYAAHVQPLRQANMPHTPFAPPKWAYSFLAKNNLIGSTRLDTIGRVLDWQRHNLTHFYGGTDYANYYNIWGYVGYPPLSAIVNGTIDARPGAGFAHYTAGCHGSVGFLDAIMRAVNIPVQPVWVCGHALAYFATEKLYLDHGDDPYNLNVKASSLPMTSFLIDEPTYQAWFTSDLTLNILDGTSPACANVGRKANEATP